MKKVLRKGIYGAFFVGFYIVREFLSTIDVAFFSSEVQNK